MSTLLKDVYSESFYQTIYCHLNQTIPKFSPVDFKQKIFNSKFPSYSWKERMLHTARILEYFLPDDFEQTADILKRLIENLNLAGIKQQSFEFMFLPEIVTNLGLEHFETAISTFEKLTTFTSCEFAVRPFILQYPEKMLAQMLYWSNHSNHHVRRLASEGARPRLPWAMSLPKLKQDPSPLLPILNNLKYDPCSIVRRSVANNLNDISKDHPQKVIEIAKAWQGINPKTDALIKHGCRTLFKQGNQEIMQLFGFYPSDIYCHKFKTLTPKIILGESLEFAFSVTNKNNKTQKVRFEYAIYYLKKNGSYFRKVFKISERTLQELETHIIHRKQSFKPITMRQFYSGKHYLAIIINGQENPKLSFLFETSPRKS